MFLLQYALEVKLGEKTRLETIIKEEESRLRKEEAELKLAEQAFDNFLQENDRKAMEAQKKYIYSNSVCRNNLFASFFLFRAEQEAKITSEKDEHIKSVEAEILQLKADIYNLKVKISESFWNFKYELFRMFIENTQCMESFWLLFHLKIGEKSKYENVKTFELLGIFNF